jgi:hypothetical protein
VGYYWLHWLDYDLDILMKIGLTPDYTGLLTLFYNYYFNVSLNDDDDVDGVRQRLWTAATNGLIFHLLGDIWAQNHGKMMSEAKFYNHVKEKVKLQLLI